MIICLGYMTAVLVIVAAQSNTTEIPKQDTTAATSTQSPQENEIQGDKLGPSPLFFNSQFIPQLLPVVYEPQLQFNPEFSRFQPQIVLFGGGQGQPILINPGNTPGNFLIPQGPGPNVVVRNNPPGTLFPVAGYPKPAHIPPIEKDAEEIPTNPSKIPPLPELKPKLKPNGKPEKLETFNEPNTPEQSINGNGQVPSVKLDSTGLRPGERFFILNGDNIFTYPYEATPTDPALLRFRYTNVEPFPKHPPKLVLQKSGASPLSLPDLILQNSVENSQPTQSKPENSTDNRTILRDAQSYARTLFPENAANLDYRLSQDGDESDKFVQPELIGQFRFVPNGFPSFYQYKDDLENDAVVVDASFDSSNIDGRFENDQAEIENTTIQPSSSEKPVEPSMAQAGPQATAIAGPGGTAGSAPRATAIVGKGGLAISSPTATAVAGTQDQNKKVPTKKP